MTFNSTLLIKSISFTVATNVSFFVINVTHTYLLAFVFILLNFINYIVSDKRGCVDQFLFAELWTKVLLILVWSVHLEFGDALSQDIVMSWSDTYILVF